MRRRDVNLPIADKVQRAGPFPSLAKPKELPLRVEDVRPVVRIAHRTGTPLNIPERIIFDHEFVLILRGRGELRTRAGATAFGPHHLFCIPPFLPHSFASQGGDEHIAVHFDFAPGVPSSAEDPQRRRPYRVRLSHGFALPWHRILKPGDGTEVQIIELVRQWKSATPTSRLQVQAIFQRLIAELLAQPTDKQDPVESLSRIRVRRAVEHIQAHGDEALSASHLARVAGLSPSRFNAVFRQWTGYSPQDFVRRARVERARRLLADIDLSIREVAERCGFTNQYHFSRVFHQIDGLSPTRYREAVAAGQAK